VSHHDHEGKTEGQFVAEVELALLEEELRTLTAIATKTQKKIEMLSGRIEVIRFELSGQEPLPFDDTLPQ
jgi:hypothetical protein